MFVVVAMQVTTCMQDPVELYVLMELLLSRASAINAPKNVEPAPAQPNATLVLKVLYSLVANVSQIAH